MGYRHCRGDRAATSLGNREEIMPFSLELKVVGWTSSYESSEVAEAAQESEEPRCCSGSLYRGGVVAMSKHRQEPRRDRGAGQVTLVSDDKYVRGIPETTGAFEG
jgi:hypothetical protein